LEELIDWGFKEKELIKQGRGSSLSLMEGELFIGPELLERHDYLVFYFDNEFDWQVACEKLEVSKTLGGQVGKKTIQSKGLGRVLDGTRLLELLND